MPVARGASPPAGFSGRALGWAWRVMWCGVAAPASRPPARTSSTVRSNGSYGDLGVIPMFALPGRCGAAGGWHSPAPRSFAWCCEAVEEGEDGVAWLVAAELVFAGRGAVECSFFELEVGVEVFHRGRHVLVAEPQRDDADVVPGEAHVHGPGVAEQVREQAHAGQRRLIV